MICISLIGYIGAGKTTLEKALTRGLHVLFIGLNWYVEEHFHKVVEGLFTGRGESGSGGFKRGILHEVGEFEDVVISTGGGASRFFDNMEYINQVDTTILLNVDPKALFRRLWVAKQQCLILQGKEDDELFDFIIQALEKHSSLYRQAKYIFCVDELEDRRQIETPTGRLRKFLDLHIVD